MGKRAFPWNDVYLLITLYAIQGVPLGLALGSVPFLLKSVASYTDVGIFTFASYPYSLKLLWSPIVDSLYYKSFGRRKTWIVPIQFIVGALFVFSAASVDDFFSQKQSRDSVIYMTVVFFLLIFMVATQDIAGNTSLIIIIILLSFSFKVDGWAISLLPEAHRSLASTSQVKHHFPLFSKLNFF